jgi:hypothetical protein
MLQQLNALIDRFVAGESMLTAFRSEFQEKYLVASSSTALDSMSQLFFDRVLESTQEVGLPSDRLHDDPRLSDETTYREYLVALRKRYRDGTLTFESPEY